MSDDIVNVENEYIQQLLKDRYFLKHETTWEQLAKRVSVILPESYEYIKNKIFIPSTPTLLNANTNGERKGTLSSCFPMKIDDSVEGIFDALKECAVVTKASGGIGINFSVLRSSNEIVGTINRKSSGPIPFMRIFNSMLDGIQQGGVRRGAGMALLDIDHPDILEFITVKDKPNELNRMNLSVCVTTDFYKKLEKTPDAPHKIYNITSGKSYDLQDSKGKIITVKELWNMIVYHAWKSGEPGIFNSTIAYDRCTNTNLSKTVLCNPCQPGWAKILTEHGICELKDIKEGDKIWSKDGWTTVVKKWSTGIKEVWKYQTSYPDQKYGVFYGTKNHKVVSRGKKIEVGLADSIDCFDHFEMDFENEMEVWNIYPVNTSPFRIDSSEYISTEEVFDITVDNQSHTYWTQGCNVCNCSEFTGISYQACGLGSINLTKMVNEKGFDWDSFEKTVRMATVFLNKVIDVNVFPLQKIHDVMMQTRPIGLGVMGFGDMLYQMGIPYNSKQAFEIADEVIRFATLTSMRQSVEKAKKLKKPYSSFDYDLFMKTNERFWSKSCRDIDIKALQKDIKEYGVYNSAFTSLAPTGSISILAEVTGGIEPSFALSYQRKVEKLNGKYDKMYIVDKIFDNYLTQHYPDKKDKILAEVSESNGSCQNCKSLTPEEKKIFVTANDMTAMEHLSVLGAVANAVSLSVSKTLNLPKSAKEEEVSQVYLEAHKLGVIGVTVYRDGCREGILTTQDKQNDKIDHIVKTQAPKRPAELVCDIHHVKMTKKLDKYRQLEYIVAVGLLYGDPYEIFVFENGRCDKKHLQGKLVKRSRGKYDIVMDDGSVCDDIMKDQTEEEECVTRMASTALRHGADINFVVHQLEKVKGEHMGTFTKVMGRVLKKYIKTGSKVYGEVCPECEKKGEKGNLVRIQGCVQCKDCNWSRCG